MIYFEGVLGLEMVSQSGSVGQTIVRKIPCLTVVQKTHCTRRLGQCQTREEDPDLGYGQKWLGCFQIKRKHKINNFAFHFEIKVLKEERRHTESKLLELWYKGSTVSDGLGSNITCWCWCTVFYQVQGQLCVCQEILELIPPVV